MPLVEFVPFARAASYEEVGADAGAPLLLGVRDEVEHPFPRHLDPSRIARGMRDVGEGVDRQLAYQPIGRVEVDHADELRLRACLQHVLDLRIERRPVVLLRPLPDERVVAVGHGLDVDGVRREDRAQRNPHVGEVLRAFKLRAEAPVADVLRPRTRLIPHGGD